MMVHARRIASIIATALLTSGLAPVLPANRAVVQRSPAHARAAFEKLRAITGTWAFTTDIDHGRVTYELVSNGAAILERVMNEEHGETGMVSMIHLDGDRLVLQHYCSAGNQPRLVSNGLDGNEIRFTFERAWNMPSRDAGHIDGAVFRFPANGRFESTWIWRQKGADEISTRRHSRADQ